MPSEILFRSEELVIHYEPRDSDTLLIAFGHAGVPESAEIWAADVARSLGWSILGISPLRTSWYPASGLAGLPASVSALCATYRRRIAYGGSMGGYGAIKWGHLFAATMTVAGAPQISIDPGIIGFDRRWGSLFDHNLHHNVAIEAADIAAPTFILADHRAQEDWQHAQAIAALSERVHIFRVPSSDHVPLAAIAGSQIFGTFIDLLEHDEIDAAHRAMARHRRSIYARTANIVADNWIRRPRIAQDLLTRVEQKLRPSVVAILYRRIGQTYEDLGEFRKALDYYNRANLKDESGVFRSAANRMIAALASVPRRDPAHILLDNLPDPDFAPASGTSPKSRQGAAFSRERGAADALNLPGNVFIDGAIDDNVVIVEPSERHVELVIELRGKGNTVIVRGDCAIDAVLSVADGGRIEIGQQTEMHGARITAYEGSHCVVGARCSLAGDVRIRASDRYPIFDTVTGERLNPVRPILIGDGVRISAHVQIARGTVIGAGSLVNPGSVLDGDYPGQAIIGGSPAKVVRTGIRWDP
jgi:acetyltransferase-like isoleucine patch superfamily enzyme/tetratricopeptide (TPR) repeat protein